jgi:hypothetical protein
MVDEEVCINPSSNICEEPDSRPALIYLFSKTVRQVCWPIPPEGDLQNTPDDIAVDIALIEPNQVEWGGWFIIF